MSAEHSEAIHGAFSTQASAFEDPRFNRVFTLDAEWLFERLELRGRDLLLDVAAGTGHASRALAPSVRCVVALDVTEAMLTRGRREADRAGLGNILFTRGDAGALPFLEESFDVIISRFAIHHFERAEVQVAEMSRCLKSGGRIALADMVASDDPATASAQNHLERLRDPSHRRMLSAPELIELARDAGLKDASIEVRALERPLQPWLEQAKTDRSAVAEISAVLHDELDGGAESGFRPREHDGELHFTQRFASVIAAKP
jgi:ubiquinone/menaquinone biosynthesis C-methylase UbiE